MRDIFKVTVVGYLAVFLIFASIFPFQYVHAEISIGASMSSDNYRILDAQHGAFGAVSSSSSGSYILLGNIGDIAIGSSSITNFKLYSGFLYYPKVVAPVLNTATAGDTQVSLAWTTATAFQGFSIGGYDICTKPAGGSYTCGSNLGTGVSATKTGLTNGTSYTFKIETLDGLGNIIAVSNEQSATPAAAATPTPTPAPSGGGGGGGYVPLPTAGPGGTITISGIAYPQSTVTFYVDSVSKASVKAGANAQFQATITNISVGSHTVGLNSQDPNGRKSLTISFVVTVTSGTTVTLSDVLLPPTIDISAFQLARGDVLKIFGQAQPSADVDIRVYSSEIINKVSANSDGAYDFDFDTRPIAEDYHTTKSRALITQGATPFSSVLQFVVGKISRGKTSDTNKDGKVNIKDFSILMYWWNTKTQRGLDIADINKDNKINVVDFSIMLFQWTG